MTDPAAQLRELEREILALEGEEALLARKLHERLERWAAAACPFKVGEVVECMGWQHRGKKLRITDVGVSQSGAIDSDFPHQWVVAGRVLRSDGTEGSRRAAFRYSDWIENQAQKESGK